MGKLWHIHVMEGYAVIKRSELQFIEIEESQIHVAKQRSQSEKITYRVIPTVCYFEKGKTVETN